MLKEITIDADVAKEINKRLNDLCDSSCVGYYDHDGVKYGVLWTDIVVKDFLLSKQEDDDNLLNAFAIQLEQLRQKLRLLADEYKEYIDSFWVCAYVGDETGDNCYIYDHPLQGLV